MNTGKEITIIAEVGSNHGGDMELAKRMIHAAAAAGVDVVKFQSWQADKLIPTYPDYQRMYEWYKQSQLDDKKHHRLLNICRNEGVEFLTTVFDLDRVEFLADLGLKRIKIASPDCGSHALLRKVKDCFNEVLISTGMSDDEEVITAAELMKGSRFSLMHCISMYPTPINRIDLARMEWLKSLAPSVGFSDHSMGADSAVIAMARGARFIEKHFTIDNALPGPDQKISNLPEVFKAVAEWRDRIAVSDGEAHRPLSEEVKLLRTKYIGKWGNNK